MDTMPNVCQYQHDPVGSSLLWALYVRKAMIPDFYGTECLVSYNKPVSKI